MSHFIAALQFLTILPLGKAKDYDPGKSLPYFPVVGLLLGFIVAGFDTVMVQFWSIPVVSLLDVLLIVFLTGALHLDGLGDTADGLYGQWERKRALEIMKDSRIGAMGLVAIICCLSIKCAGVLSLDSNRTLLLIIVPAYSRASVLFGMRFLKYARSEGGTGQAFFERKPGLSSFYGIFFPVFLSFFLGWKCGILNGIYILLVVIILIYYYRKLMGITGDMLGAMIEVIEAMLFLILSMDGIS